MTKLKALINITIDWKDFKTGITYNVDKKTWDTLLKAEKEIVKTNTYVAKVFENIKPETSTIEEDPKIAIAEAKRIKDEEIAETARLANIEAEKVEAEKVEKLKVEEVKKDNTNPFWK